MPELPFDPANSNESGPLITEEYVRRKIQRILAYNKSISEQVQNRRRDVFHIWMRKEYRALGYRTLKDFLPEIHTHRNIAMGMIALTKMERILTDQFGKLGLSDHALRTLTYRVEQGHAADVVRHVLDHHIKVTADLILETAHILGVYKAPKTNVTLPVTKKTQPESFEKGSSKMSHGGHITPIPSASYLQAVECIGQEAVDRMLDEAIKSRS